MRTITEMPSNYDARVENFKSRFFSQHKEYLENVKRKEEADKAVAESRLALQAEMNNW